MANRLPYGMVADIMRLTGVSGMTIRQWARNGGPVRHSKLSLEQQMALSAALAKYWEQLKQHTTQQRANA